MNRNPRLTAILLPGFLGSSADWKPVIKQLTGSVRCVTISLLDHLTIETLDAAIRQQTSKPVVLMGYSMGARIALHLLLRDPQRYLAGILLSGSPGLLTAVDRAERRRNDMLLSQNLRSLKGTRDLSVFLKEWYSKKIFAGLTSHRCYQAMLERRLQIDTHAWANVLDRFGTGVLPSLWEDLPNLRQPTLAVAGSLDHRYTTIALEMENRGSEIRSLVLPNCSHAVLCCKPTEFAKQVLTFIDKELSII